MAQLRKVRYPGFYDASMTDETLDNELATPTSDGLMSKEDKVKLDSLGAGSSGPVKAEDIVETEDKQFVSEDQIDMWNKSSQIIYYDPEKEAVIVKRAQ